ncbi:MAG: hypothetical protein DME80_01020 [Verrucomicrobia bacterium]|nr:MAG: hypothetical protein DME80_01020 [Verrucomicrobiota bacterium]
MLACNEKEMLAPSYFRKSSCGKQRQKAAMAYTLNLFRGAASLLANAFGVGFIDWLGVSDAIVCLMISRSTAGRSRQC